MRIFMEEYSDDSYTVDTFNDKEVRVSTDTEVIKALKLRNMNILISSEQKKYFIENIFADDEEKYQRIISLFNYIKTWHDADSLLDLIYHNNNLNPLSEQAREFTSIVRNCFDD